MLNSICSPEMSFNSDSGDEPHAYVNYVDDEKETVPLTFIYKFPLDWRTTGWNKNYLYKVFWSPEDDDSPSQMLKREPEVPLYEGTERKGAGYYRAAVLTVQETLAELLEHLKSGKRLSIGLSRYKHTSNDLGQSQQQIQTAEKSKQLKKVSSASSKKDHNGKPVILKKVKENEKKKLRAARAAQVASHNLPQVQSVRTSLKQHYPSLFGNDIEDDSPVLKSCTAGGMDALHKSSHKTKDNGRSNRKKNSNSTSGDRNSKEKKADGKSPQEKRDEKHEKESTGNLSQDSKKTEEKETGGKAGTENILQKTTSNESEDKKIDNKESQRDLNNSLVETTDMGNDAFNCLTSAKNYFCGNLKENGPKDARSLGEPSASDESPIEGDDEGLNTTVPVTPTNNNCPKRLRPSSRSSAKRKILKESSSSSDGSKKFKFDPDFTPRKYVEATQEIVLLKATIKRISNLNMRLQEKMIHLEDANDKLEADLNNFKENCKCGSSAQRKLKIVTSTPMKPNKFFTLFKEAEHSKDNHDCEISESTKDNHDCEISESSKDNHDCEISESSKDNHDCKMSPASAGAQFLCEVTMGESQVPKIKQEFEEEVEDESMKREPKQQQNTPDPLKFEDSNSPSPWQGVSLSLKEMILKIGPGPKKDLKFIKELGIVLFGPEVLAGSSIFGTKKGAKAKGEETKLAKPKLDNVKLNALEAICIQRLCSELKISTKEASQHERFSKKRINDTLRDAQKWCRKLGYGQGILDNKVDEKMFEAQRVTKDPKDPKDPK